MPGLRDLVEQELSQPVDPRVTAMAEAIASRHGQAARAVLFYGSCLRQSQLEGLMLDFYLIVSDYRAAYAKRWLAVANRLIPPNVFYVEHGGLSAKYAVLSQADFHRLNGPGAGNVSVWARFAQPSRLVWVASPEAREQAIGAVSRAAPTLLESAIPLVGVAAAGMCVNDIWKRGFEMTYGAELRAERSARPASVVDSDPQRYEAFGRAALEQLAGSSAIDASGEIPLCRTTKEAVREWRRMQRRGKWLSVIRLAKASATFAGGVDYIAWKINRHAGTKIEIKPWQRRWPLLAAISLAPRLLKSGAIR